MDDFSPTRREEILSSGENMILDEIQDQNFASADENHSPLFPSDAGEVRQGRRAVPNHLATPASTSLSGFSENDLDASLDFGGSRGSNTMDSANSVPPDDMPPRPSRRQGGWADDNLKDKKSKGRQDVEAFNDDERLRMDNNPNQVDDDGDTPIIPDLEEVQEEDMATQIAAPPSIQVNRVATYRELDNSFQKHAALFTLDGEIDLKLLSAVLSPESQVFEEDKQWDWDRLFTEVASDLQTEWEKGAGKTDS